MLPAAILIEPDTVSLASDSAWVTITVTLTNTTNQPVREQVDTVGGVPLTDVYYQVTPTTGWTSTEFQMDFYYTLAPAGTPGSTRRVVIDQHAPLANAPTQFSLWGVFGMSTSPLKP